MITSLRKSQLKRSNFLKKIKVEGEVDEKREVIVRRLTATIECEGFKSLMVLWAKVYGPI
jgi:hypothetical protein